MTDGRNGMEDLQNTMSGLPAMNDRPVFQSFSAGRLAYEAPTFGAFVLFDNIRKSNPFMGYINERGIYPRDKFGSQFVNLRLLNCKCPMDEL
jgi:hypothetical protein